MIVEKLHSGQGYHYLQHIIRYVDILMWCTEDIKFLRQSNQSMFLHSNREKMSGNPKLRELIWNIKPETIKFVKVMKDKKNLGNCQECNVKFLNTESYQYDQKKKKIFTGGNKTKVCSLYNIIGPLFMLGQFFSLGSCLLVGKNCNNRPGQLKQAGFIKQAIHSEAMRAD